MPRGVVRRAQKPPLAGDIEETAWARAEPLSIDRFPWYETGRTQATTARILYDDRAVYLQYQVEDVHCSATVTELNGPVYEDSCVEFFAATPSMEQREYVNFEANCCGTFLLGFGTPGDRRRIGADLADGIRVATPIPESTTSGPPAGDHWWLAAALPFQVLSDFAGVQVGPGPRTTWRANCYRCGGEVDPHFAAWADIEAPEPDFHRPADFGTLEFE